MACMALSTLKYFFANSMKRQIMQIQVIIYAFLFCQVVRSGYESFENIRNVR